MRTCNSHSKVSTTSLEAGSVRLLTTTLLLSAFTWAGEGLAQESNLKWQSSEITKEVGGYMPQRLKLTSAKPAGVKKMPEGISAPLFGEIKIGPTNAPASLVVLVDEPGDKPSRLFVDSNGNGDLTDDPSPKWETKKNPGPQGKQVVIHSGEASVLIPFAREAKEARLGFYRFDKNDEARAAVADSIFYFREYAWKGQMTFAGQTLPAILLDELAKGDFRGQAGGQFSGVRLLLDLNADGKYDLRREGYDVQKPFNVGGTTWELSELTADGKFKVVKSSQTVPEVKPAPNFSKGAKAIPFTAKSMEGKTVKFPEDYKGKVVLLDFWATWCGPCLAELPNVLANYAKFHSKGLEILGISLDREDAAAKLAEFTKEKKMTWPQIYDGKMWQAEIAQLYAVEGIPFMLLVDGDSGEILAGVEARGESLGPAIERALLRKTPAK